MEIILVCSWIELSSQGHVKIDLIFLNKKFFKLHILVDDIKTFVKLFISPI